MKAGKKYLLCIIIVAIAVGFFVTNSLAKQAAQEVIVEKDGIKRLGSAWMAKRNGIYVLYLEGSAYDMGYQHGALLREEIAQGEAVYLSGYLRNEIKHSVVGNITPLARFAEGMMHALYYDPIARKHPDEAKQALHGLADGSGLPYQTLARVMTHSDSGQTMEGKIYKDRKVYPGLGSFSGFGCTSFMAAGPATKDGHVLHGRNFDYPGAGWFDKYPVVAFCKPSKGQRYVMITSAGLHTGGITGLNESGLAVGWDTAITTDVQPAGIPIFSLVDKILREAVNIDQALAIIKAKRPSCGYIIFISSAKEQKGVGVELSRRHLVILPLGNNTLAVANSYRTPELMKDEIALTWSEAINSMSRTKRMNQLLRDNFGKIDPQKGAEFLGDHFDINTGRERATGDAIGQASNVSSVVIDSTAMNLWVASGQAPVCNTSYVGFNFEDGFKGPGNFSELPVLHGTWEKDPRLDGLHLYNKAQDKFTDDDFSGALEDLKSAMNIDPNEPVYAQSAGLLMLKTGKARDATGMFEKALALPQTSHKQSLGLLWLARSYDLEGKRDQALEKYRAVLQVSPLNPGVKQAAKTGMKKPFTLKQAKAMSLVFDCGDNYSY
jgi:TolA-binding protein